MPEQEVGSARARASPATLLSDYPNHIVVFDLFGPFLPTRAGNQYVEVATDLFCKYVQLRAVKSSKAEESGLTLRQWVAKNGALIQMLSDCGTNYTSEFLKETARAYSTSGRST